MIIFNYSNIKEDFMRLVYLALFCLIVSMSSAYAESSVKDLEARYQKDTSSPKGEEYEKKAVIVFWGDAKFMRECAPPDAPIPQSFKIYFIIKKDGSMGELVMDPVTEVGKCMQKTVIDRKFPKPHAEFVIRIDLQFK
jgi:hypothetical protein